LHKATVGIDLKWHRKVSAIGLASNIDYMVLKWKRRLVVARARRRRAKGI